MDHPSPVQSAALAKLAVPRIGRVFPRERLFAAMDALTEVPGLWIAGPPGAGKTTLTATWGSRGGLAPSWFQIEAMDADPATFARSLDALWRQSVPEATGTQGFGPDDLADLGGWLQRRVARWLEQRPPPWTLVFDNHQELPADSPLQQALAQVLARLPRGVQWVFISREPPPAAFAAALARQHLALIDPTQLRFDEAETRALARLHGRPEAAAQALAAAQGWAAGMTLMLLGAPGDVPQASPRAGGPLFDYFAGEVLGRMPPAEQRALGAIAWLPAATPELAVAQSGHAEAPALLARLAAASLFTDRRGGASPVYVFHALFSAFLRGHAERMLGVDERRALQRRAARLLARAGDDDAALEAWAQAECWTEIRDHLLQVAPRFVAAGRTQALRRCIDLLPPALREALVYWRGVCLIDADPAAALDDLVAAHAAAVDARDVMGQLQAAAGAATALVQQGKLKALDPWIDVLSTHGAALADAADEATEMRLVPGFLAALVHRASWHPLAEPLAERAERLLHRDGAPGQRLLIGCLAYHLLWRGHVDRLERIVLKIDALCASRHDAPLARLRWWGVGIVVKSLLGQHDSALADAQAAIGLVEAEPALAAQRAATENLMVLAALAARDVEKVRRHGQRAAASLHPDNALDRTVFEHQRGIQALLEDDSATALRLMRASDASARDGGFPMRVDIALIAHALAAARHDEHDEARSVLDEVFAHPFHAQCRWHHWVAGMVAAYAALRRGDEDDALAQLRRALAVARECGFRHGPMLYCCGDMMPRLAALALREGIEPEFVRSLVRATGLRAPAQADETWPWPLRVRAFGGLQVLRDGVEPPASRKESRRLMALLHLLVAHGAAPLKQDALADLLWPDADGDAARNALDNALHRLRKWLGGEDTVLLRQGAPMLDPERCWSDVVALERLLARQPDTPEPALAGWARDLARLYVGPLLPEDDSPAIVGQRRALDERVRRALARAITRLQAAGLDDAARVAAESLPDR